MLLSFSDLEEIIRNAIKLSCIPAKTIAKEVGLSNSGIYCFLGKQNHISIVKGDAIFNYLKENDLKALRVAADLYLNN